MAGKYLDDVGLPEVWRKMNGRLNESIKGLQGEVDILRQTPNPNLLLNWYFGNLVNRSGKSEYVANGATYIFDRWNMAHMSARIEDGYLKLIKSDASSAARFRQPVPGIFKAGTQLTLSALVRANSCVDGYPVLRFSKSTSLLGSTARILETPDFQLFTCTNTLNEDIDNLWVEVGWASAAVIYDIDVIAMKLELGPVQTLAHEKDGKFELNEIPLYAEQYLLCSKYDPSNGDFLEDGETYSTKETRIGTWINGKPLYRKVISTTTPSGSGAWETIGHISDFDMLVRIQSCVSNNAYAHFSVPSMSTGSNLLTCSVRIRKSTESGVDSTVDCYVGDSTVLSRPITCIVEYTKTADEPSAAFLTSRMNFDSPDILTDSIASDSDEESI